MSDNYELDDVEVKPFMEEVNQQVQQLTKLKWAVEEAEEALRKAEAAYDKFVRETLKIIRRLQIKHRCKALVGQIGNL